MLKERGLGFVIILSIFTFGIYWLYWFYSTSEELKTEAGYDYNPLIYTILLFIPIANFYAVYKIADDLNEYFKRKKSKVSIDPLMALILYLLAGIGYVIVMQLNINKYIKSKKRKQKS